VRKKEKANLVSATEMAPRAGNPTRECDMADKTKIEWTDATWNPVTGCTKVSSGCKHCYAERDWARLSANPGTRYYGRPFNDVQCHHDVLTLPLRWTKPRRIFVNSMSDLFHPAVSDQFIADVFGVMAACPQHTFQVLTKRPERAHTLLSSGCMGGFEIAVEESMALYTDAPLVWPIPNVWLGVSIEDQTTADVRIPLLLRTHAAVRWISAEPLLGPVDLSHHLMCMCGYCGGEHLDWVVVGGESGTQARPMHPDWVRGLRDQCDANSVPFLFKQWGEWADDRQHGLATGMEKPIRCRLLDGGVMVERVGKKSAGRRLDGEIHDGYPD